MYRVLFLRSNSVMPDPRVEKEVLALLKKGMDVKILAWNREENLRIEKKIKKIGKYQCEIVNLGIKAGYGLGFKQNLIPLIKFQVKILKYLYLNRKNIDIIHACDFDTVIPTCIISKLFKKKYIYDIFDYYIDAYSVPNKLKKLIKIVDNYMITNADATIICTEKRINQIKGSKPKNLTIIHNTPNIVPKTEINNKNIGERTKIVYVGILAEGRLIKELVDVVSKNKQIELHIAGFGKLEKYILDKAETNDNVYYYGKISYEKAIELENSCDIMTALYDPNVKNHYYAAPNKFYEALMLGKPLIMVKNTGMDDIIEKNKIGEVISYNIDSLEKAIINLNKNKKKWNDISLKMRCIYKKKYSWYEMENRLCDLYRIVEGE